MKFVAVQESVLHQMSQLRKSARLAPKERMPLCSAAAQAQVHRYEDEFKSSQSADGKRGKDLDPEKGVVRTHTQPSSKDSVPHTVDASVSFRGTTEHGEMYKHALHTLKGEEEPYRETYEFTKFRKDGISHSTITVMGDGGISHGSITATSEFLSSKTGKGWREQTQTDRIYCDVLTVFDQGIYQPTL